MLGSTQWSRSKEADQSSLLNRSRVTQQCSALLNGVEAKRQTRAARPELLVRRLFSLGRRRVLSNVAPGSSQSESEI